MNKMRFETKIAEYIDEKTEKNALAICLSGKFSSHIQRNSVQSAANINSNQVVLLRSRSIDVDDFGIKLFNFIRKMNMFDELNSIWP